MSQFNVSTENRRDDRFRYGQSFSYSNIDHMVERSTYAYRLSYGVIDDAISKGFKIMDNNTEKEVKWMDEFTAILKPMWLDVLKTFVYERQYGKAFTTIFDDGTDGLLFRTFSPKNYFPEYSNKFKITKVEMIEYIGGTMSTSNMHTLTTQEELDKSFELIVREKEKKGQGFSVFEPTWNVLYSLRINSANLTKKSAREGGGLFYAKVLESKLADSKYMSKIHSQMRAMDTHGSMVIPVMQDASGAIIDKPIESLNSGTFDFIEARDVLLGDLSAGTGIPREVWLGSELGLKSAETNQSAYFNVLREIQQDYIHFWEWLINTFNSKFNWFTDFNFEIVYNVREVMDEEAKLELLLKKADLISKLRGVISDEELGTLVGMKLIEKEEIPVPLQQPIEEPIEEPEEEPIDENV